MAGPWEAFGGPAAQGPWSAFQKPQEAAPAEDVATFADRFGEMQAPAQAPQRGLANAVTDIPGEIAAAAGEAVSNLKGVTNRGQQGPVEGLINTGKAVLAVPQLLMSPITGAARAVGGNLMTQAEHAAGTLINPEVAKRDNLDQMYATAKGDVDTAMSAAAPGKVPVPKVAPPTIQELKAAARAGYEAPEVKSLEVKPETLRGYSDTARASLNADGFDDVVAPKTFALLDKLQKVPPSSRVTGDNFNSLRKTLGKVAQSPDPAERAAASRAIDHLDDFVPTISGKDVLAGDPAAAAATLAEARGNYAAAKQAEKIDGKLVQAEVRAASANSGMNVANTIRQRMADVVLRPKEARGLRPEEIAQAKAISEGTRPQNALRAAGNMMGGGGGIGAAVIGAGAGVATGGPGAVLPLVGMALRGVANQMTVRQAQKLSEAIRSRAPLASSAAKLQQAAAAAQGNRTPQAMAGLVLAARNLSTNLRSAGFNVGTSDLIRGLQGPMPSGAEDEQQ
ncbi:hypothetical protein [Rhodopseudomonas sp. B29]|uniref:hypothetical protein n=1 Tax=Rhodopseudomonas sp. B29 TaxID=95607 RepID=UPI0003B6FA5C|nr:hypothetical protein [Rhodopseudomonas sp. B29]